MASSSDNSQTQTKQPGSSAGSTTSQANPQDMVWQELQRVKQEIDQNTQLAQQTDAQGDPTYAAMQAQKSLTQLNTDYRNLLVAYSSSAKSASKTVSANPNDPYIMVQQPDGTITPTLNPNYQGSTVRVQNADGSFSDVPYQQAKYESDLADAKRQAAFDQAKFQWQQAQDTINNQLKLNQLSLDQATKNLTAAHDQITAQLTQQTNQVDYAKAIAPGLFSDSGMADFNGSLGTLAKLSGSPFTPVQGVSPSLPVQLATDALAKANPQLAASLGQTSPSTGAATNATTAAAAPAGAKPTSPAPAAAVPAAAAPLAKPAVAPAAAAPAGYVAPRLSPTNQAIQAGLGPGSGPASVYAAPGLNPYALGT